MSGWSGNACVRRARPDPGAQHLRRRPYSRWPREAQPHIPGEMGDLEAKGVSVSFSEMFHVNRLYQCNPHDSLLPTSLTASLAIIVPRVHAHHFSMGDSFMLSITCACRLHWSVRRGPWSRVV